jgi:predicted enzyme related to lactoylglutathione lyase
MTASMSTPRISSFGIEVGDIARSSAFYTETLRLNVALTIDNDHFDGIALNGGGGGASILLMRTKGAQAPGPGPKTGKVVLITDDVVTLHAAAVAAGATSAREPENYPGTSYTIAMVRDFDGNLVEMIQTA